MKKSKLVLPALTLTATLALVGCVSGKAANISKIKEQTIEFCLDQGCDNEAMKKHVGITVEEVEARYKTIGELQGHRYFDDKINNQIKQQMIDSHKALHEIQK